MTSLRYGLLALAMIDVNSFDLSDLDGKNGFEIDGDYINDNMGFSVSYAGDFNGDGFGDLLVGAPHSDSNTGSCYIIFGTSSDLRTNPVSVSGLDGNNGVTILGDKHDDFAGYSVSGGFDFNNDGFDDIIIGAYGSNKAAGTSYIIYGTDEIGSGLIYLSELKGLHGFALYGINASDASGYAVSSVGDLNNDGFDDVIIGAKHGNQGTGEVYVVYGEKNVTGVLGFFTLENLNGVNGFVLKGLNSGDGWGGSVSTAGDVNGDKLNDIIVGGSGYDYNGMQDVGAAYVLFGNENLGVSGVIKMEDLDESAGYMLYGVAGKDNTGCSVSSAGDFNQDGYDDIMIGASGANDENGFTFIVFGGETSSLVPYLELDSLNGEKGFILEGQAKSTSGTSVSGGNGLDFNGDGYDDIVIGAPTWTYFDDIPFGGASLIVYGSKSFGSNGYFNLEDLTDKQGFSSYGDESYGEYGQSVSIVGDVNGDGFSDVIIGATNAHGDQSEDYVITGVCYVLTPLHKKHHKKQLDYFPFILLGGIILVIVGVTLLCYFQKQKKEGDSDKKSSSFYTTNDDLVAPLTEDKGNEEYEEEDEEGKEGGS